MRPHLAPFLLVLACCGADERPATTSHPVQVPDGPPEEEGAGQPPRPMDGESTDQLTCPSPVFGAPSLVGPGRLRGFAATRKRTLYALLAQPDGRLVLGRQRRGEAWELDPLPDDCRLAAGRVGRHRLALDSAGVPHVLCGSQAVVSGRLAWSLELFTRRAGLWSAERIASATSLPGIPNGVTHAGEIAGLALAADGTPHVVFTRRGALADDGTADLRTLHVSRGPETQLRFFGSLDDVAIGTDPAGEPRVVMGWMFHVGEHVELQQRRGGAWHAEDLATTGDDDSTTGLDLGITADTTFVTRVDNRWELGIEERGILEVLEHTDGGTRRVEVDGPRSHGDGAVDPEVALTLPPSGQPILVYRSRELGALRLARRDPGGFYLRETLLAGTDLADPAILVLANGAVSVAFSTGGETRIMTQRCP